MDFNNKKTMLLVLSVFHVLLLLVLVFQFSNVGAQVEERAGTVALEAPAPAVAAPTPAPAAPQQAPAAIRTCGGCGR